MTAAPDYSFAPAIAEHLEAIWRIEQRVSPFPWTRQEFADSLAAHRGFVLRRQRKVIGFAFFSQVLDQADLLNIAIDTSFQGEGHGRRLLKYCFEELRRPVSGPQSSPAFEPVSKMFLEVRASNVAAISLYTSNGFVVIGARRAYYHADHGREDALVMCRHFESNVGA